MKGWARRTCHGALALAFTAAVVCPSTAVAESDAPAEEVYLLGVDRDDDDVNGQADGEEESVSASDDLFELPLPTGKERSVLVHGDSVRVLVDGKPLSEKVVGTLGTSTSGTRSEVVGTLGTRSEVVGTFVRRVSVQAVRPGRADVQAFGRTYRFVVVDVRPTDGDGNFVDPTTSHASFERIPPGRLRENPYARTDDTDALRFVLVGQANDLPGVVRLVSRDPAGVEIDALESVALGSVECVLGTPAGLVCGSTVPIRLVPDEIDRNHPSIVERSVRAVLGGRVDVVSRGTGRKLGALRVGGPRSTPLGPLTRYRGHVRVFLVRPRIGGPPPVGTDDAGALALARAEVAQASALWAACGIGFGPPSELEVAIVDPPRPHLVALGCDLGLSAAGTSKIRVRVDGREVAISVEAGITPGGASRLLAAALMKAGFSVRISDNAAIGASVRGTSDVLIRRKTGEFAFVEPPAVGPISTDSRLTVCLGRVDLEDGLQHFGDVDAIAGTVEERALIKAFDDGDPSTIEVFVVPSFASGGRIGESFIGADGGAIRNVLIEDRAALRADRASFALAHELGHVLLDEPGHPDDFGRDTPSRLMDADAANGTAFGPRRLLVEECVRAFRQSGPSAAVPLLQRWPLRSLGVER